MELQQDLQVAIEKCLGARGSPLPDSLRQVVSLLQKMIEAGQHETAALALRQVVAPSLDYTSAQSLYRVYKRLRSQAATAHPIRLAVLSSFTAEQLVQLIELFSFSAGAAIEVYQADYGVFRQEILDAGSGLYRFQPRVVFIASSWRDLSHVPQLRDGESEVDDRLEAEFGEWMQLWRVVHDRLGCQILQNNFDAPPWRTLDNHELRQPGSLGRFVARMNLRLAEEAPPYVTVHDIDHLACCAGRWNWSDERFFHQAKLPCGPENLVDYAHSVSSLIAAQAGLGRKCLVLDLDNTLWGGVIGDDGLGGIRLGQGEAEGEAYQSFQRYVKSLKSRGVILAICSKNEDYIAREVFEKHSEMVLRLSDISCFVANWVDKASNLRTIAQHLNIGLHSLVFVDDNPAERSIIRQMVPEVAVPELPADPAGYLWALARHRYFQPTSISKEDFERSEMYRANAARTAAQASSASVEDFLRSLQMTARIGPIDAATLERATQLINRSNQFNLTTRRYSAAEVVAMVEDSCWLTRTVLLADRFGDNGLISVLLGKIDGDVLLIDTWLMSCRVLKRGVEDLLLNHIAEVARTRGVRTIRGMYIPTPKNDLVREHYSKLGFTCVDSDQEGRTWWELTIDISWSEREVFIEEEMPHG